MFESFLLVFHLVCAMIHFMLLWSWKSWVVVVNDVVKDTGLSQFFSLCILLSFEQFFELFQPLLNALIAVSETNNTTLKRIQ